MTEKFINSLHNGPAITPSIHDCKIIKPKELSRGKQLGLLGFGVIELGCSFTNILPVLLMTLTGLEMFISGIESNNPAELIGGV